MRAAQIAFMFLALACAVLAVWDNAFVWQWSITAALLLFAAAGIEASKMKGDEK